MKQEFPEMTGLSQRNLEFMQQFASSYQILFPKQAVSEMNSSAIFNIPWGHNITILQTINNPKERLWYASQTVENGWSRNVLMHQIKSNVYKRQTSIEKTHNFDLTLPNPQSDLVVDLLKDEYNFEFLRGSNFKERELEDHLINNITKFLLELGKGFAFIGKQYHIEVGG